jgi:cell division protein ZapA
MPSTEPVRVTIFNQTYSLVASEEPGRIEHLAQRVDDLMSSIAVRAGNIDATRAAVLACLHLADELESTERRLASLKDNVDLKAREFTILLDEAISSPAGSDTSEQLIANGQ